MFLLSPEEVSDFPDLSIKLFHDSFSGSQDVQQLLVLLPQVERL